MIDRKSDRTMRRTDAAFYHTSQAHKPKSPKTAGGSPPPLPEILQHCGGNPPPPTGTSQTYGGRSAKTTVGFFLPPMIEGS